MPRKAKIELFMQGDCQLKNKPEPDTGKCLVVILSGRHGFSGFKNHTFLHPMGHVVLVMKLWFVDGFS